MLLFFLIYIITCLYGIKFCPDGNKDYLSIDTTASVKGIFILLVFFSHFNSYTALTSKTDLIYHQIVSSFGQTMVTLFLFYSGYGVMEAIKKKGIGYIDTFPSKRILATLFRFDCAVLLFLLIGWIFHNSYTLPQILLSLLGWESLGNSNWYIFVILVLYLVTYLGFKLIKSENHILPFLAVAIMVALLVVLCWRFNIKPLYWFDTALCYVAGMFCSLVRKYWDDLIARTNRLTRFIIWAGALLLLDGAFLILKSHGAIYTYLLSNVFFALLVVCFTMQFQIKNRILLWCGNNLFELYILQRIPMIVFQQLGIDQINIYLYFVLCLVVTILLIKPFQHFTSLLWKLLPFK